MQSRSCQTPSSITSPQHKDNRDTRLHHEPAALPDQRLVEVTGEWLPEGTRLEAYWNGEYWNGWVTPLFPLASVHRIVDLMPGIDYNQAEDAVLILNGTEIDKSHPISITVNGEAVAAYVVGDGFCWELAT